MWFAAGAGPEGESAVALASATELEAPPVVSASLDTPAPTQEPQRAEPPPLPPPPTEVAPARPVDPRIVLVGEVRGQDGSPLTGKLRVSRSNTRIGGAGVRAWIGDLESASVAEVHTLHAAVLNADYSVAAVGGADERGRFRIDLTELLLTQPSSLVIKLEREGLLPVEFEWPLALDAARWGLVEVYEIRAELIVPARCEVVGRIVAPPEPEVRIHPRPPPSVAIFEWVDGGPQVAASSSASCDRSSGDFRVQLECDRDYVLVALLEGFRPWTRRLDRRDFVDLGRVVLERGESIAGRARVAGEPVSGAVRARFKNASAGEYTQCCIAGRWLVWTGAGFEWESQGVVSSADGRFEVSGLAPASYTLELGSMQNAYASAASLIDVVAPSGSVELGPRVCRVELQVFDEGALAAGRTLEISEVGRTGTIIGTHRTDANGVATLWVDPARSTSVALAPLSDGREARPKSPHRIECAAPGAALSMRVDF